MNWVMAQGILVLPTEHEQKRVLGTLSTYQDFELQVLTYSQTASSE